MIRLTNRHIITLVILLFSAFCSAQQLPTDGKLTIDSATQKLAKRLLKNKQGSIVALNPSTGEIICMVSHNKIYDGINRAISMTYSPGSTFKTAQALTLLSENELSPWTSYKCNKGFWQDNIHIGCHQHDSPLDLVQAIGQSCNSYFCKAFRNFIDDRVKYSTKYSALRRWHRYMTSMGLGKPLGIDMQGELSGEIPDSSFLDRKNNGRWNGTTIMWMGMGQGEVTTTPLQLCNLAALIGNRGWYITPHIHANTTEAPLDSMYIRRHYCIVREKAFKTVIEGMRAAVINGTCAGINTQTYKICGKTGTAENEGNDHSIFMGFAPMGNPKIAVSVYVENGGFGADLAAPLASLVMEQFITGKLSQRSKRHAYQWENYKVKITPVEIPINLDDL